jgi:hypothetical protein
MVTQRAPLFLQTKSVVALVDALAVFGFTETYALPNERARYISDDDTTVVVGYDGSIGIYAEGDGREIVGAALIESGGAV